MLRKLKVLLKRFLVFLFALSAFLTLIVAAWRIPWGERIIGTSTVRFQMLDLGQGGWTRVLGEELLGNRRLFLVDDTMKFVYVPEDQFHEAWRVPPSEMKDRHYTVQVTYSVRKLLFSPGYTPADLLKAQPVVGDPVISK